MSESESRTANFCTSCGEPIQGARFCGNCGTPSGVHQAVTPAMAAAANGADHALSDRPSTAPALTSVRQPARPIDDLPVADTAPPMEDRPARGTPARHSRRRLPKPLVIALCVAPFVVAGVIAAIVLSSGSSNASQAATGAGDAAYRQKVADAFGPVLGANQQVSNTISVQRGRDATRARLAVSHAQQATTSAQGALGALTAPPRSTRLAADARQVLDREAAYLAALGAVLRSPSVAAASQLQTLSSNLTSAFDTAGPAVAGRTPSVSGADHLVSWARQTVVAAQRAKAKARAKARRKKASRSSASGSSVGSTAPANPVANGRSCGGGVFAGTNTSCEFAFNVRDAYNGAPGLTASVRVYSPVTGQTYTMDCAPSGSGVTCSGANNASVTF